MVSSNPWSKISNELKLLNSFGGSVSNLLLGQENVGVSSPSNLTNLSIPPILTENTYDSGERPASLSLAQSSTETSGCESNALAIKGKITDVF